MADEFDQYARKPQSSDQDEFAQYARKSSVAPVAAQQSRPPMTFMDRISSEMNGNGRMLDPESVVRGVGDSLGRTTKAWGDMFSGNANAMTPAEMIPLLGPSAVDAGRNLADPARRLEGFTDAAMLLGPAAEGGVVSESRMPLQYRGDPIPRSGRTVIPPVPQSVIDASHAVPGAGTLRLVARGANALGRVFNRPDPEINPAFPPQGRRVYDMRMSPQSPASYDPRPLPDISDRGVFGAEPPSSSMRQTPDEIAFESAPQVFRPALSEAWQIPNKSYPLPSKEVAPLVDTRSGSYRPMVESRTPTADELAFDAAPKRFVDSRESQVIAPEPVKVTQPAKDTPASVRDRAKSSRAKFDENGKRNQLK